MEITIHPNAQLCGIASGKKAAELIRESIQKKGNATVILATGASQFETLKELISDSSIDWSKVTMFHLDEYIGIPDTHPASFRKYLTERFLKKVSGLKAVHLINAEGDPQAVCDRLGSLISEQPVDMALVGIGENSHLAFNDPPADFDTEAPYIVVELDEACRTQQFNEGWFATLDEVPRKAISMSVKQIMKSAAIICTVPDERKAQAVKDCLEGPISNLHPAGILRQHPQCFMYLDAAAASLLSKENKHTDD